MAGPTASVLLGQTADVERVRKYIEDTFQTMQLGVPRHGLEIAYDGWIDKRHLIVTCGLKYEERFEEIDMAELSRACGFAPVDEIGIAAMVNSAEDHFMLARVCCFLAEEFHGIIALHGKPWDIPDAQVKQIPGQLIALRDFDGGEPLSEERSDIYCDAIFLKNWMKHTSFRMVK